MTIIHQWFEEVWNQGCESAIDELSHPEKLTYGLTDSKGKPLDGMDGFRDFYRQFRAAMSDIHVTVEETITEGDLIAARCAVTARHTGEWMGKPPKGNRVKFTGMAMARLKDGKIHEAWNNFDFLSMVQQMD
jgi:predicted ester cyclase